MTTQGGSAWLPRSFKSWAVVDGKIVGIEVGVSDGDVGDVIHTDGPCRCTQDDEQAMHAWAAKALAWLKVNALRASKEDLAIRDAVEKLRAADCALEALGLDWAISGVARAACEAWRGMPVVEEVANSLRIAHMTDLVDRCSAEMKRQAEEVVS